jgi:hypothetical protein
MSTHNSDFEMVYTVGNEKKNDKKLTVEMFFNRMLAMSTLWQDKVFAYFTDMHENELVEVEATGDGAVAGVTMVGVGNQRATLAAEEQICTETDSGSAVMHISLNVESGDIRLGWKMAWRKLKECGELAHDGSSSVVNQAIELADIGQTSGPLASDQGAAGAVCGFYEQKRSKRAILVVKERMATTYAMWRPNSRKSAERRRLTYRQLCERLRRFSALSNSAARTSWVRGI